MSPLIQVAYSDSRRSLEEEEPDYEAAYNMLDDRFDTKDLAVVADDDAEYAEESFEMPLWGAMLGIMVISVAIVLFVFYSSYKHESICGKSSAKNREEKEEEKMADQLERGHGARLSMKKFSEADVPNLYALTNGTVRSSTVSVATEESSVDSGSVVSSNRESQISSIRSTSTLGKSFHELVTAPRCVLCSVTYKDGEDVAHSNNPKCHHEFHRNCLMKQWAKDKTIKGKCPVCKEAFYPDEHQHHQHANTTTTTATTSPNQPPPSFDA